MLNLTVFISLDLMPSNGRAGWSMKSQDPNFAKESLRRAIGFSSFHRHFDQHFIRCGYIPILNHPYVLSGAAGSELQLWTANHGIVRMPFRHVHCQAFRRLIITADGKRSCPVHALFMCLTLPVFPACIILQQIGLSLRLPPRPLSAEAVRPRGRPSHLTRHSRPSYARARPCRYPWSPF